LAGRDAIISTQGYLATSDMVRYASRSGMAWRWVLPSSSERKRTWIRGKVLRSLTTSATKRRLTPACRPIAHTLLPGSAKAGTLMRWEAGTGGRDGRGVEWNDRAGPSSSPFEPNRCADLTERPRDVVHGRLSTETDFEAGAARFCARFGAAFDAVAFFLPAGVAATGAETKGAVTTG